MFSVGEVEALGGIVVAAGGVISGLIFALPRLRHMRAERAKIVSDTDVQELTSAAGAIDAAARSLKIMLDAVPGNNAVPEHQVASVIDATAQAMLAIINSLPRRVLAAEVKLQALEAELQEMRQQVTGLSQRPIL